MPGSTSWSDSWRPSGLPTVIVPPTALASVAILLGTARDLLHDYELRLTLASWADAARDDEGCPRPIDGRCH